MRSLSKDVNVQLAANYIVNFLRNRFSPIEIQHAKEIEKLAKEKAVLKVMKEELNK